MRRTTACGRSGHRKTYAEDIGQAENGPGGGKWTEGGFALVFVIFAIMVLSILGALALLYAAYALRSAVGVEPTSRALAVAEAGLGSARAMLASEAIASEYFDTHDVYEFSGDMYDGDGVYEVRVEKNPEMGDLDPYDWRITSTGTYTATVEGVERTFSRTVQEVVTFGGKDYYDALNYLLFSKEGKVDMNLEGNLVALGINGVLFDGEIYAGRDVTITNAANVINGFALRVGDTKAGNIYSEHGDIIANNIVAGGLTNIVVDGGLFSREGGVGLSCIGGIMGGGYWVTGDIQAGGDLAAFPGYSLLVNNTIGGAAVGFRVDGNVYAREDVAAAANMVAAGLANIDFRGSIHSGGDVSITSIGGVAGAAWQGVAGDIRAEGDVTMGGALLGVGGVANQVGGSIRAGGDVDLASGAGIFAAATNTVAGDVRAEGDVDIEVTDIVLVPGMGYNIGGDIYGRDVTLKSYLGAAGSIGNIVGGNIYSLGNLAVDNRAGVLAIMQVQIGGSAYSASNLSLYSLGALLAGGNIVVGGEKAPPPGLEGWLGVFSHDDMMLKGDGFGTSTVVVDNDAGHGGSLEMSRATIGGSEYTLSPEQKGQLAASIPAAGDPEVEEPAGLGFNVMMPECDFDYYRTEAQYQDDVEHLENVHYHSGDTTLSGTEIPEGSIFSSQYVIFVDGNLTISQVGVGNRCKGVFVATGDIILNNSFQGRQDSEFQFIAGERVISQVNVLSLDSTDTLFVYAAHKSYDPVNQPVSVEWEMGWFRGIKGQITARGDIKLKSSAWFLWELHSIIYERPTVFSEGFRIPFAVKTWKEL